MTRYRLRLDRDAADPRGAFVCYGQCRGASTEEKLLACLSSCPGFEITPNARCGDADRLPRAFCLTRAPAAPRREPSGVAVAAVLFNVALIIGLAAACSLSSNPYGTACGYPPYAPY